MALSFRAVGTTVQATTANTTLVEPAGTLPGDLLVAFIAYRDALAFTVPAGWTKIEEENSGDVLTTSAGISSCVMAYIVRGMTAPSYVFTRASASLSRGNVTAYGTTGGVATYDVSSSDTMAASGVTLTVSGITTTKANATIIAGMSGLRGNGSQNWSAQACATDPTTLTERVDTSNSTSPTISQSVADAQQTTTGATGAFTATNVFSARHCGALAAFYELGTGTDTPAPVIADCVGTTAAVGTSRVVTLPSTLNAGDMCLVCYFSAGTIAFAWPTGWTELADTGGSTPLTIGYRICDGSEGGTTITLTASGSGAAGQYGTALAYRITGAHQTTDPAVAFTAQSLATTADPPALTTTWGVANNLWLAFSQNDTAPTSWPSGYTYHQQHQTTGGLQNQGGTSGAALQANASTQDPGAFTYSTSLNRRAATVAVRPAPYTAPAVTGTIAQTLAITAQAASGTVTAAPAVTGTAAQTLAPAQQSASGTVTAPGAISGTIAQTLIRTAQAASGTVTAAPAITGTIAQTLIKTAQAASGTSQDQITGTAAQTLKPALQAASGTVTAAPAVTGTIAQTLVPASQAATGAVTAAGAIGGVISQTLVPASQALAGTVTAAPAVTGTIVQTLRPASQAATGLVAAAGAVVGSIAQTLSPATQAATGAVSGGIQPPDGRPVGGFAGWSEAEEQAQRTYRRLKRRAEVELREMLEAQIRGEEYPPAQAEQVLAELMAFPALPVEMPFMPDLAGLRAQLALLEQALRQGLAEQELKAQMAREAMLQEEMAIVALLA